jgi:hypothetical protein
MSRNDLMKPRVAEWSWRNPWVPLLTGLAAVLLAWLLPPFTSSIGVLVRLLLVLGGLVSAGGGIWLRLQFASWQLDARARSAGVVAFAALVPLVAFEAMDPAWDSARLVLGVLTGVAIAGAVLILLPSAPRRAVLSLLVLVHFGGILTAVTSVPPPNGEPPWLVMQAWSRFYRHYLMFMYLNNAYHFYSPDPGPPTLLWFYVEYDHGEGRWVKIPSRDQFSTRQEYQRRLALTESTNQVLPQLPQIPDPISEQRLSAGRKYDIPPHPFLAANVQFRPAIPYSQHMNASYARYVARHYPSTDDPQAEVTGVKVYRVVHTMLTPQQFNDGLRPNDATLNWVFYQGDFDPDGKLKDPKDPFLYWMIPVYRVAKQGRVSSTDPNDYVLFDYVGKHAQIKPQQ